ncbi:MAG: amidohydrolase [Microbacteriaceae bacterium]|nr:amidohydrolase [Microbacteriaceae bacterium]
MGEVAVDSGKPVVDLLIINGQTFTASLDGLDPVYVAVVGDRVTYCGQARPDVHARRTVDVRGGVVLPGLISAHTHVAQAFGTGIFDDLHLTQWLVTLRRSYSTLTDEQVYAASLLGALESIRSGVTFINDMATAGQRYDVVAQAIADSGIRAHVGSAFLDRQEGDSPVPASSTDAVLDEMRDFHERWDGAGSGRIRAAITPVGLPSCSEALMRGAVELAADLDAPLHTHCSEEKEATAEAVERFGESEVSVLDRLGVLGPRTTAAHCVWVDDTDIGALARSGTLVAHCPSTNLKITDGIAPVELMRQAGVKLALGTDGAASSGGYDLLQEARLASMLAKGATMDSRALPNDAIWGMLAGSAQHFGNADRDGSPGLYEGMLADIAVIAYPRLHLVDERRFLSNLVFSATAADVGWVLIGGQMLVEDGCLTQYDEIEAMERVRRAMASLAPLTTKET